MTDLEYDLTMSIEWMPTRWEDSEAEVDCEETAKNLTKLGYQKVVWHDAKKELPERNKYVLGYCASDNTYAVVKCDCYMVSKERHYLTDYEKGYYEATYHKPAPKYEIKHNGICYGTKDREPCDCGGDKSKCNFKR